MEIDWAWNATIHKNVIANSEVVPRKKNPLYILISLTFCPRVIIELVLSCHFILSPAATKGAPVNGGVRTCGGLKVVFPHCKCHYITHIEYTLSLTIYCGPRHYIIRPRNLVILSAYFLETVHKN